MAEDIQQKFQEIQQQKERLNTAKQNLKTAISGKGVTVPDGIKLDEYYTLVNAIQQGGSESGGTDVSATTATEADVLNGKQFYKADGTLVEGNIQTVTPTLTDNVFSVKKGYVSSDTELTVPESKITETTEKITVGVGYIAEQKEFDIQNEGGLIIPGTTGDYILPDDFNDDIKIAFWKHYEPVETISLLYTEGGDPTARVWSNTTGWTLSFYEGKWTVTWWNEGLEMHYSVATNATLRKHKWTIIEPSATPDQNIEFDFVSLEDKNWQYNG